MLYFIPTPIGNREDITLRALRLMTELKFLLCEDTRTTKKLLQMYQIPIKDKSLQSFTSFSSPKQLQHIHQLLLEQEVGILSEAGTPGLSDPGKQLIQFCIQHQIPFSVLPGANALIPAVVGAGFDTSKFIFWGFLPQKKGRTKVLQSIIQQPIASFFYESVHRIAKLFRDLELLGFDGQIAIARELSKAFENFTTLSFVEAKKQLSSGQIVSKGEFVIGLYPPQAPTTHLSS